MFGMGFYVGLPNNSLGSLAMCPDVSTLEIAVVCNSQAVYDTLHKQQHTWRDLVFL